MIEEKLLILEENLFTKKCNISTAVSFVKTFTNRCRLFIERNFKAGGGGIVKKIHKKPKAFSQDPTNKYNKLQQCTTVVYYWDEFRTFLYISVFSFRHEFTNKYN